MILVDTSVWIDYLNGIDSPHSDALDLGLQKGNIAIGDLIFLEILQGIRSDKDYQKIKTQLSKLDQYELFGQGMVESCANNYRFLRKKGRTIRATADVIIATYCIENNISLLFKDRDFTPFVKYLGLQPAFKKT